MIIVSSTTSSTVTNSQRSWLFLITIGLFGLPLSFNASSLDPFVFNEKIRILVSPAFKNSALGLVTILALLIALLVQPLVGQWSDRTYSRWGKRIPYLVIGAAGLSVGLVIIVIARQLAVLVIGAMLVSAFANTAQAVWQAFIPDFVPLSQHGRAAGVKTVLELTGIVIGVAAAGYFLARGILWGAPLVEMVLFWLVTVIIIMALPRSVARSLSPSSGSLLNPFSTWKNGLKRAPPAFLWWMTNRILFWAAAISVRTFLLNFLEDVIGISPAEAQALASQIFVILGLGVFVLALPAGIVADRVGRRPVIVAAGLMAASGTLIAVFYRDISALYLAGGLIAVGAGIYASSSWSLATHLAPRDQGALYLGLANGATVLGSISGRTGGVLIDAVNHLFGTVVLGYQVDFGVAILFFLASSLVALKIPEPKR